MVMSLQTWAERETLAVSVWRCPTPASSEEEALGGYPAYFSSTLAENTETWENEGR